MPFLLTVSCFSKIQIGLPFWYRLTRVVPEKGLLNGCVCVCVNCLQVHGSCKMCPEACLLIASRTASDIKLKQNFLFFFITQHHVHTMH